MTLPAGWRVPTFEELLVLPNAGYSDWIIRNGVRGRHFGIAPNQIFLPAAGQRIGRLIPNNNYLTAGELFSVGLGGLFWSSTPVSRLAKFFSFGEGMGVSPPWIQSH